MRSNGYTLQIACCASCTPRKENSPSRRVTAAHHFQGSFSRSRSAFLSLAAVLDSRFPFHSAISPYKAEPACKRGPRIRP